MWLNRRSRRAVLAAVALAMLIAPVHVRSLQRATLAGKVTARLQGTVLVSLDVADAALVPVVGDRVVFTREVSGFEAQAGEGRVTDVKETEITVEVTSGRPDFDGVAMVFATGARAPTPTPPEAAARPASPGADGGSTGPAPGLERVQLSGLGEIDLPAGATRLVETAFVAAGDWPTAFLRVVHWELARDASLSIEPASPDESLTTHLRASIDSTLDNPFLPRGGQVVWPARTIEGRTRCVAAAIAQLDKRTVRALCLGEAASVVKIDIRMDDRDADRQEAQALAVIRSYRPLRVQ
jgi:hypothetical protein